MTPDQGDVLLFPVPFTDLSSQRRRPVLVLSSLKHNTRSPDVIVAAITSNLATPGGGIEIGSAEMEQGALPAPTLVRPDKIYALSKSIIVKHYGRVKQETLDQVLGRLAAILTIQIGTSATLQSGSGSSGP